MSDSLYESNHRNYIRPKLKGIMQFGESTCDRVGNSLYFKHEVEIGKDRIDEVKHADLTGSEKKLFIGAQNKVCEFERKKVEIHKGY